MAPPDGATPEQGGDLERGGGGFGVIRARVVRDARLSTNARTAYAILATFADADRAAWPGVATLTELIGASEATTHRALRELVDAGHLAVVRRFDDEGRQRSNRYVLDPAPRGEGVTHDTPEGVTRDRGEGVTGDTRNRTRREQDQNEHDDSAREPARLRAVPAPTLADAVGTEASTDVRAKVDRLADALDDEFLGWQHGAVANAVMEDEAGVVALVEHARAHGRNGGYVAQACRRGRHVGFAERAATPAESPRDRKRREANEAAARFLAKATRWQA